MRPRYLWALTAAAIPACAAISGLDGIKIADEDATVSDAFEPVDTGGMDQVVVDAPVDAGNRDADAGADAALLGVKCTDGKNKTVSCVPPTLCCVVSAYDSGLPGSATCRSGACALSEIPIRCAAKADCDAGLGCCGKRKFGTDPYIAVECAATCLNPELWFCNPQNGNADCPSGTCAQSAILPGYYVCN